MLAVAMAGAMLVTPIALAGTTPTGTRGGDASIRAFVRGPFDAAAARARGVAIGASGGGWTAVRLPGDVMRGIPGHAPPQADLLAALPGAVAVVPSPRVRLALDAAAADMRLSLFRTVGPGGVSSPAGAGVLIGIVDTGIDLAHADFRNSDGTTRIVSLWDQTSAAGSPPAGFDYGSEWNAAAIDAGTVPSVDELGHGTHVAGIAAGNGRGGVAGLDAGKYVGVAPLATLCIVKLDFLDPAGPTAAEVADGVAYVFAKAAALGMPAVVNLSLGSHEGPHDGTSPFDEMLSSMEGPGRIVVAAAGNEGSTAIHSRVDVPTGTTSELTFFVPDYTPNDGAENDWFRLSAWHDRADSMSLAVVTPTGATVGPVASGSFDAATPDGAVSICVGDCSMPGVPASELSLTVRDADAATPPRGGVWKFRVTRRVAGGSGRVDGYLTDEFLGAWAPTITWQQGAAADGTLRSPATADSVLAVGAHVTKPCWTDVNGGTTCYASPSSTGQLAFFSSRGPRRDGVPKLDLTAPGMVIASTRSAAAAFDSFEVTPGGAHVVMMGTSIAAPMVSGAAALLLGRPGWSGAGPTRLRDYLRATARADGFTGAIPNNSWGYGKLDLLAAMSMTPTAVESPVPPARIALFALSRATPNPFNPSTEVRLELARAARVWLRIHGPNGSLVRTLIRGALPAGAHLVSWNGRDDRGAAVASGIYYLAATVDGETATRKMTLLK
jgi:hypothetical protein